MESLLNLMPSLLTVTIVLVITYAIHWFYECRKKNSKLPPGPTGIPFLGYMPFIPKDYGQKLMQLSSQYGKIFSMRLGSNDVVMISDYEILRQIMQNDVYNCRPPFPVGKELSNLTNWDGPEWKEHRKFSLRVFKQLGVGKKEIEENILNEVDILIASLEHANGKAVMVREVIGKAVANVVSLMVMGERLDYDSQIGQMFAEFFLDPGENKPSMFGIRNLPFLIKVVKFLPFSPFKKLLTVFLGIRQFMCARIQQLKQTYDTRSEPTCFMEAYLKEMSTTESKYFDESHLFGCAIAFFAAGSNTTRDFLTWSLLYLMIHTDVQERLQHEVDRVIGTQKPSLSFKKDMPYTEAMILEVYRHSVMLPFGLMHAVGQDVDLGPYHLPKGTLIAMNMLSLFRNPGYFACPDDFNPGRFVQDGKFVRDERVIPFGIGKRACPGEPVAVTETFLFLVSLVQHFEIIMPDSRNYSDQEGKFHFLQRVPMDSPIEVVFKKRVIHTHG